MSLLLLFNQGSAGGSGITRSVSETELLLETLQYLLGRNITLPEQEAITETIQILLNRSRSISETESLIESVVRLLNKRLSVNDLTSVLETTFRLSYYFNSSSETESVIEQVLYRFIKGIPLAETLLLSEQINYLLSRLLIVSVEESVQVSETISYAAGKSRSTQELLQLQELILWQSRNAASLQVDSIRSILAESRISTKLSDGFNSTVE